MRKKLLLIKAIESHCRFQFSKLQVIRMLGRDEKALKKMARFVIKAEKITGQRFPNWGKHINPIRRKHRKIA